MLAQGRSIQEYITSHKISLNGDFKALFAHHDASKWIFTTVSMKSKKKEKVKSRKALEVQNYIKSFKKPCGRGSWQYTNLHCLYAVVQLQYSCTDWTHHSIFYLLATGNFCSYWF